MKTTQILVVSLSLLGSTLVAIAAPPGKNANPAAARTAIGAAPAKPQAPGCTHCESVAAPSADAQKALTPTYPREVAIHGTPCVKTDTVVRRGPRSQQAKPEVQVRCQAAPGVRARTS